MRNSSGDVPAISKSVLGTSWLDPCWNPLGTSSSGGGSFLQTGPGILPPSLSHFPADSTFVERAAARFSCFGATSSGGMATDPFDASMTEQKKGRRLDVEPSGQAEFSGGGHEHGASSTSGAENSSSKNLGAHKRRSTEDVAMDQTQGDPQISTDTKNRQKSSTAKPNGKQIKDFSEDYIHVRARHGQATNSHSLAERVRREKISQRMKLLQELVPGCSKVTGKALMLDEIINYVQSLQQQVEFLSMKLATVNPRLDTNVEALLSKDLLRSHGGSSSAIGFSPHVVDPQLHPSQQGPMQTGIFGDLNTANYFRRTMDSQLSLYKGHTTQMPISCDEELQNVMQMAAFCSNHLNNRDGNPLDWNEHWQTGFAEMALVQEAD
ncbi:hypothetical protein OPV22_017487 [Ensete ventricosum]|uniref:BHLH domain-containing protein n=1 Tax=Ensete ventricosum TaxID=4639 RepID=A0AAV8QY36_ENSVE|nr:hypothetical protein OPV22_017487 [Ensete ventricosum]